MRFFATVKQIYLMVIDALLPRSCTVCEKSMTINSTYSNICNDCCSNIFWISETNNPLIISSCKSELRSLGYKKKLFKNGAICWEHIGAGRKIILALKYRDCRFLAKDIVKLIQRNRPDILNFIEDSILVPVPLSYWKRMNRDYNQSFIIARELAKNSRNVQVKNLLRSANHCSQTMFQPKERLVNVKNTFFARKNSKDICNKRIIVIDDVITTGATLAACCSALFDQGFVDVNVLTLSHG